MHVGVHLQFTGGRERFGTKVAFVWLILTVGHLMVVEVGGRREPLVAERALIRLYPEMESTVDVEGGRGCKLVATDIADERLLARVHPHVAFQHGVIIKRLVAQGTLVRFFYRVGLDVSREVERGLEPLPADLADMRHVVLTMGLERVRGRKHLTTDLA